MPDRFNTVARGIRGRGIKTVYYRWLQRVPDGTLAQQSLWVNCCIRHDLAYWKGGTYEERLAADQALEACVARVGEPEIARLMLAGVRVGGAPYFPTSYRWGYGWPYLRGYKALTDAERQQVRDRLRILETMVRTLSDELGLDEESGDGGMEAE
jgi:hypothetical protein